MTHSVDHGRRREKGARNDEPQPASERKTRRQSPLFFAGACWHGYFASSNVERRVQHASSHCHTRSPDSVRLDGQWPNASSSRRSSELCRLRSRTTRIKAPPASSVHGPVGSQETGQKRKAWHGKTTFPSGEALCQFCSLSAKIICALHKQAKASKLARIALDLFPRNGT